jgi:hypothetical protein
MKKNFLIFPAIAFLALSSCKKNNETNENTPENSKPVITKTDILTAKSWKLTAATISPGISFQGGPFITDFYQYIEDCKKDDLVIYKADGKLITDEGASKCNPDDPQTEEFNWSFSNNETKIIMDGDTSTIMQLDSTTLRISTAMDGSEVGGINGRIYTLSRTLKNN